MPKGKATGRDRKYQLDCLRVLQARSDKNLVPFTGDGVDVFFPQLGGTRGITFDIALVDAEGNFTVAECKRYQKKYRVEQGEMILFAAEVEILRKATGQSVAGFFFVKSHFQVGALMHAEEMGINLRVFGEDHDPPTSYALEFPRYDRDRDRLIQSALIAPPPITATARALPCLFAVVHRTDGTSEDLGELK